MDPYPSFHSIRISPSHLILSYLTPTGRKRCPHSIPISSPGKQRKFEPFSHRPQTCPRQAYPSTPSPPTPSAPNRYRNGASTANAMKNQVRYSAPSMLSMPHFISGMSRSILPAGTKIRLANRPTTMSVSVSSTASASPRARAAGQSRSSSSAGRLRCRGRRRGWRRAGR